MVSEIGGITVFIIPTVGIAGGHLHTLGMTHSIHLGEILLATTHFIHLGVTHLIMATVDMAIHSMVEVATGTITLGTMAQPTISKL